MWRSVVGKLWLTIIALVVFVLSLLGVFLLPYIDMEFAANSREIKQLFIIVGIIGFSMTTLFALFLSLKITRPLVQLRNAAARIAKGEYHARADYRSSDEIGQLARAFNSMAEKLDETVGDLNYQKDHLASILSSITDAVITFKKNGEIISTNPRGKQLAAEWQNNFQSEGEDSASNVPEPLKDLFAAVVSEEKVVKAHINVGNQVWSVVLSPLYTSGAMQGAVAVLRDATKEVNMEKMRQAFVANVSHELRTPLSMLQGYSEALLDDIASTPEERRELAQVIYDESLRMGRLVSDLLDLAGIEAGRMQLNFGIVNVYELLQRMVRKFTVLSRERGIALKLEIMSNPKNLLLEKADEDRLEQVLTNLLDNAFRHTPEGKRIFLRAERIQGETGEEVVLQVEDEGQGIPEEDVPYIFDRFYKADKARKRAGGTGLGLAIAKNIVEAHNGNIAVQSRFGQGTTFTVTIPVHLS